MNKENIAFLFAGQGAQYVGMGKELCDTIPECGAMLKEAEEILNMPIKELIFDGPIETLVKTENAQPAILLIDLIALKALELNGVDAKYASGLSLGEYGALVYGNKLSFKDALLLVKERGRIMGSALPKGTGKMAAVMKLNDEQLEEVLAKASEIGVCQGANYNCPGQVVISGDAKAIEYAITLVNEMGGKAVELKVDGPFHSSLLTDASNEFYETIKKVNIEKGNDNIVYSNVKGLPYEESDDIRLLLKNHIMTSVLFEKSIRDMINKGVTTFIEIGPGKALRGFVRRIDRSVKVLNVEDMSSLEKTLKEINAN